MPRFGASSNMGYMPLRSMNNGKDIKTWNENESDDMFDKPGIAQIFVNLLNNLFCTLRNNAQTMMMPMIVMTIINGNAHIKTIIYSIAVMIVIECMCHWKEIQGYFQSESKEISFDPFKSGRYHSRNTSIFVHNNGTVHFTYGHVYHCISHLLRQMIHDYENEVDEQKRKELEDRGVNNIETKFMFSTEHNTEYRFYYTKPSTYVEVYPGLFWRAHISITEIDEKKLFKQMKSPRMARQEENDNAVDLIGNMSDYETIYKMVQQCCTERGTLASVEDALHNICEYFDYNHVHESEFQFVYSNALGGNMHTLSTSSMKNKIMVKSSFEKIHFDNKDQFLGILDRFLNCPEYYLRIGMPYTFGILLHGEPGTGKTTFVRALAEYTKRDIVTISTNDHTYNDIKEKFEQLICKRQNHIDTSVTRYSKVILMIEEIDCVFGRKRGKDYNDSEVYEITGGPMPSNQSGLLSLNASWRNQSLEDSDIGKKPKVKHSMQKVLDKYDIEKLAMKEKMYQELLKMFLEFIDGLVDRYGLIVVATTNHIENVDPAIMRPGRLGNVIELRRLTKENVAKYYVQWFEKDIPEDVLCNMNDRVYTQAEIGELFLLHDEEKILSYLSQNRKYVETRIVEPAANQDSHDHKQGDMDEGDIDEGDKEDENMPANQRTNQPANQPASQPINQLTNERTNEQVTICPIENFKNISYDLLSQSKASSPGVNPDTLLTKEKITDAINQLPDNFVQQYMLQLGKIMRNDA